MDMLRAMRVFVAVVDTGGFASASKQLRMSPPAATRDVAALEQHLRCKLLLRSTRRVRLTEAGSGYLADARRILGEIDEAEQSLAGAHGDLVGRVTVTAPVMFGRLHVGPHVLAFGAENPGIQFDLRLLDRVADLLEEGIDVAIRIAHLPSSSATAIRVGSVRRVLCASPAYLARHGTPRTLADAAKHDAITLGNAWEFAEDGKKKTLAQPKPRFLTNSIENAIEAALAGMGLVQLLSYQVSGLIAAGRLRRVLSSLEPDPVPVHIVHLEGRAAPRRVRAFIDYLAVRLRSDPALKSKTR